MNFMSRTLTVTSLLLYCFIVILCTYKNKVYIKTHKTEIGTENCIFILYLSIQMDARTFKTENDYLMKIKWKEQNLDQIKCKLLNAELNGGVFLII